jgi:hypothetical protein
MKTALGLLATAGILALSSSAGAFCLATTCTAKTCTRDAGGCPREGIPVRWRYSTIEYRFQDKTSVKLQRSEARAALRQAFHAWSDAVCPSGARTRLRFREGEDLRIDQPLDPTGVDPSRGYNGIFFRDDGWPHRDPGEVLAITRRSTANKAAPEIITSARIEINTSNVNFALPDSETVGPDLVTVMTHEVGHFIGILHSEAPNAIMRREVEDGAERFVNGKRASRRLSDDDIEAVCLLYPPGEPDEVVVAPAPASPGAGEGCGASGVSQGALGYWVPVLMLGIIAARRRAHRAEAIP